MCVVTAHIDPITDHVKAEVSHKVAATACVAPVKFYVEAVTDHREDK